ncbi:MAG: polyprenyl synthetase family protein [Bacteroidales bacterium]|nr:polyprenyl synthetase family protein [Bacteroidales bacterium]
MSSFVEFEKIIAKEINNLNLVVPPEKLYQPIEYVLSMGGKRLRPVLTLMACNMFEPNFEKALPAAIALEMFHNFTLLHDDIMDNASLRRNMPTVHKKWDNNTAILSGDAMMIKAYGYIIESNLPNKNQILSFFNKTALKVCEGQQYDMDFETRDDVSEKEYLLMIRLKTAELLAACLKIGALCSNTSEKNVNLLYESGIDMGLAFQLQDDYLDVFGDTEVFGKKVGGDILCNKKTFLLIKAFELANEKEKSNLFEELKKINFVPEEKIAAVTKTFLNLGIKELTKNKIKELTDSANKKILQLEVEKEKKSELLHLINKLSDRLK